MVDWTNSTKRWNLTYQPGHSGGKTSRAFGKGASGTYSSVVVDVEQNSYGTVLGIFCRMYSSTQYGWYILV